MAQLILEVFGQNGGTKFDLTEPHSVGFRGGRLVDAIILNGQQFGRNGGRPTQVITLDDDDYWNYFHVRAGRVVDHITLRSKKGVTLSAGTSKGGKSTQRNGVLITGIGGRAGRIVDQLQIEYISNYVEPISVLENARFILDMRTSGLEVVEFEEHEINTLEAFQKTIEVTSSVEITASAKYSFGKAFEGSVGAKYNYSKFSKEFINNEVKERSKSSRKSTHIVEDGETSFQIAYCDILRDENDIYFIVPSSPASWVNLKDDEYENLYGSFFLSPAVSVQTGLKHDQEFGFDLLTAGAVMTSLITLDTAPKFIDTN